MDLKTLELLTSLPGGSGQELNVRKVMEDKLSKASEILKDGFGGVFGKFEGKIKVDGKEYLIENLIGFAEMVKNRW